MTEFRVGSMVIEDAGSGAAVVMVHGLGGTSNSFQPLMEDFGDWRVLRPDLPGAGRSTYRPGLRSLARMADALSDTLRGAGLERAHFVGHSMGTLLCQYFAAAAPDRVASLTLFGALLEPPVAARQGLLERAATARQAGLTGIADAVSSASVSAASRRANPVTASFVRESLMRQDPAGYAAHCEALAEAAAAAHADIRCPTLLVAGDCDPVAPPDMVRRLGEAIHGARVEILPDCGHWMMVEAPERSTELLRAHLEASASRSGTGG